jgi:5'-3' exonuclease
MIGLLDADTLLYAACYSTEYRVYFHPAFGTFRRKKELSGFLKFNVDEDDPEFLEPTEVQTVTEPISHTYNIIDANIEKIRRMTDCTRLKIFVARKGPRFRKEIEYPVVYKGGRAEKPTNFQAALDYLTKCGNATTEVYTVADIEVDDAVAIEQMNGKGKTVIITEDKDLKMIPGWNFNPEREERIEISPFEADRNFWIQMLTGDRVDNILGIDGVGPVTAAKMLAGANDASQMEAIVKVEYQKEWPDTWEKMFEANRVLLWILRDIEPDRWKEAVKRAS